MTDTIPRVGWGTKIFYGIGSIASAIKTTPTTAYLILYYNQVVGLSALTVSTVMMLSLVLDAVFDPLVGQLSDNFRSRWGRRIPFMYASAVPVPLLFLLLWFPPAGWSHGALTAWFATFLIGLRFFDTFFEAPHQALVPELARDYDDRTRLFAVRTIFDMIGGIGASLLAFNVFMRERADGSGGLLSGEGYPSYARFAAVVIFVTILICTVGLHRRIRHFVLPPARKASIAVFVREMAATLRSRSLAVLAAAAMFFSIAAGITAALNLYWNLYYYELTQFQMSLLTLPTLVGIVAVAATSRVSARMGKRNAAILLCWVYMVATCAPVAARLLGLIPPHSNAMVAVAMIQTGIGTPAMLMVVVILASTIADLVEDAELRTGRRSEGLLLSTNNLVRKASQGLGALGAGVILMVVGFPVGVERHQVPQEVLAHMAQLYLIANLVLFVAATLCLRAYRGNRAMHEENVRKLAGRALPAE